MLGEIEGAGVGRGGGGAGGSWAARAPERAVGGRVGNTEHTKRFHFESLKVLNV